MMQTPQDSNRTSGRGGKQHCHMTMTFAAALRLLLSMRIVDVLRRHFPTPLEASRSRGSAGSAFPKTGTGKAASWAV
jgi:hypothetical protein